MTRVGPSTVAALLFGIGALMPAASSSGAQDLLSKVAGAVEPPAGKTEAAQPLSPRDIAVRADADERFAQDVVRRSTERGRARDEASELATLELDVTRLSRRMRDAQLASLPPVRLESLRRHWMFHARRLEQWRRELQRRIDGYSEDAADLSSRRAVWIATRTALRGGAVVSALSERIDEVIAHLNAADRAVSRPLAAELELGQRANAVQASIDAGLRGVAAASENFDRRLGRIDEPPLWEAWRDLRRSPGASSAFAYGNSLDRDFLRSYFARSIDRLWLQAGFAVLLLPFVLWMRARSRSLVAADPTLRDSTQALMRPVSAWLVLTLLATIFLQPDAPMLLHQVALLLAVIPVLRLLPKEVFDLLGAWPYAVTALVLFQRLGFLLIAQPFWHRLHLLAVTLLTLGVLLWMLRHARRTAARGRIQRAASAAGWLGVLVLTVAAVANVFGGVSLAEVLTRAALDSAYVGLVLYAGATVISAIVKLLLARRNAAEPGSVVRRAGALLGAIDRFVRVAAVAIWGVVMLSEFRVYRPLERAVGAVLTYPLGIGEISLTLGSALLFVIAVYLAFWIARTIRTALQEEVLTKMSLPRGVANSVSTLSYYALLLIGLFIALAAAGFQVGQLAIVVGALSVGIGFGLQNVVNNFVSGLILMFERPIQPGDVVEITGTTGTVREIGMRATTLTTAEGADVVVPNGTLLSEKLVNWTLSDTNRRIDVDVGVAYGTDPKRALELLKEVAASSPGIAAHPAPVVIFKGFGASSLDFGIRAWTEQFGDWVGIRSEMTVRVHDALAAAGIEIPFPQQDVHIRSVATMANDAVRNMVPGGVDDAVDTGAVTRGGGATAADRATR